MSQYSQGYIKSMRVLDIQQEGDLFLAAASVEVLVNDFRRYIKKYASESVVLNSGIFGGIANNIKNAESKLDILRKRFIKPIASGSVYDIKIGEVETLQAFKASGKCNKARGSCNQIEDFDP